MDYPSVPFIIESTEARMDPVLLSTSRGGLPRSRRLYDRTRRNFQIVHRGLTDVQKAAVEDFLLANRLVPFTIYWPCRVGGVAYLVQEATGITRWSKPEGLWSANIDVVEAGI